MTRIHRTRRLLALAAGTTLGLGALAGAAVAETPPAWEPPVITIDPCIANPQLPQCPGGGPIIPPDLDFHPCTWFPELCETDDTPDDLATPEDAPDDTPEDETPDTPDTTPDTTPDGDDDGGYDAPHPADAVSASPNFTG